jgi:hypothetical protein
MHPLAPHITICYNPFIAYGCQTPKGAGLQTSQKAKQVRDIDKFQFAFLAQLEERRLCNSRVVGSNPTESSTTPPLQSPVQATQSRNATGCIKRGGVLD